MATGNFDACLTFVLRFEGGKSNDPNDPGGRTNQGVTQATYDAWRRRRGLSPRDVYRLEAPERDLIYRDGYWNPVIGNSLRLGEDLVVFDPAVNSGPAKALKWHRGAGGSNAPVEQVIHGVCAKRLSFMHALKTWSHFGAGWGRRVAACEALAIQMVHGSAAAPILRDKADKAVRRGHDQASAAAGSTAIGAGATQGAHLEVWMIAVIIALTVAVAGVLAFKAWRQQQRADALTAAAKAAAPQAKTTITTK